MTTPAISKCQIRKCKRFIGIVGPGINALYVCDAFPLGIPDDILFGNNLHLSPVAGDGGLLYSSQQDKGEDD